MREIAFNDFASPQELADALASAVAADLARRIEEAGRASLAVSGGTTPKRFLEALSKTAIAWEHVDVTLADDRFVPPSSDRSNERLVRECLLKGAVAAARFVPLRGESGEVEAAAEEADRRIGAMGLPLDVVVLGMGTDGHTASIFPDADRLEELFDPDARRRVLAVRAKSAGEPRLSLTLAVLAGARYLYLHIEGEAKRAVLDAALAAGGAAVPIATVLRKAVAQPAVYRT